MNRYIFILIFSFFTISIAHAETIRIMPLGDSITEDWAFSDQYNPRPDSQKSGYRNYLWYALKAANLDVDFVGTHKLGSAITPKFDIDNEGWSGLKTTQVALYPRPSDGFYYRLKTFKPHIILLHLGTNDWSTSTSGIRDILDEIDDCEETEGFHTTVVLAQIINKRERSSIFSNFNRNLQTLVNQRIANGDDIVMVDMENDAGIRYSSDDFQDRIHPNNSGYKKMANVWFKAIENIIKNDSDFAYLIPAVYSLLLH